MAMKFRFGEKILVKLRKVSETGVGAEEFTASIPLDGSFKIAVPFIKNLKISKAILHFAKKKFRLAYTGGIVCGSNLGSILIPEGDKSIVLRVPSCEIRSIEPNVSSFRIENSDGAVTPDVPLEDLRELIKADLERQERLAIRGGILERSNEKLRKILVE